MSSPTDSSDVFSPTVLTIKKEVIGNPFYPFGYALWRSGVSGHFAAADADLILAKRIKGRALALFEFIFLSFFTSLYLYVVLLILLV